MRQEIKVGQEYIVNENFKNLSVFYDKGDILIIRSVLYPNRVRVRKNECEPLWHMTIESLFKYCTLISKSKEKEEAQIKTAPIKRLSRTDFLKNLNNLK